MLAEFVSAHFGDVYFFGLLQNKQIYSNITRTSLLCQELICAT